MVVNLSISEKLKRSQFRYLSVDQGSTWVPLIVTQSHYFDNFLAAGKVGGVKRLPGQALLWIST